jgi:hypothetical protein
MSNSDNVDPSTLAVFPAPLRMEDGWRAELVPISRGALLRIGHDRGGETLDITITITAEGPIVRARAAALEIESDGDLVARCERFRVEARESIEMVTPGSLLSRGRRVDVEATHGSLRMKANDNVQLLGENILLNCEPSTPPMPGWALRSPEVPQPTVPVSTISGLEELSVVLKDEEPR